MHFTVAPANSVKASSDKKDEVEGDAGASAVESAGEVATTPAPRKLTVPISVSDYVLGIADLTGELMRLSISCLSAGDRAWPLGMVVGH